MNILLKIVKTAVAVSSFGHNAYNRETFLISQWLWKDQDGSGILQLQNRQLSVKSWWFRSLRIVEPSTLDSSV